MECVGCRCTSVYVAQLQRKAGDVAPLGPTLCLFGVEVAAVYGVILWHCPSC